MNYIAAAYAGLSTQSLWHELEQKCRILELNQRTYKRLNNLTVEQVLEEFSCVDEWLYECQQMRHIVTSIQEEIAYLSTLLS